jgi:hypothetical protein
MGQKEQKRMIRNMDIDLIIEWICKLGLSPNKKEALLLIKNIINVDYEYNAVYDLCEKAEVQKIRVCK